MKQMGSGKSSGKSGAMETDKFKKLEADIRQVNKTVKELKAKGMKSYGVNLNAVANSRFQDKKKNQYANPAAGKKAKKK